ncbi:MAG: formyltransferase family protein [bacterium]|nr:formyltransferase family protein [bacterium]
MAKRIAVLISDTGTGTNLQAIINGIKDGMINANIAVVISDTRKSLGLKRAKDNNLKIEIVAKKENLLNVIKKYNPDFICLAGWKQFIINKVIDEYPKKIINLHPGLIPETISGTVLNPDDTTALWNKGKLADLSIKNFFDQHSTYAGSSIHFLTHEFDFGPVLGRCFEKIDSEDTINSLYSRLKIKENMLYVEVLKKLCK